MHVRTDINAGGLMDDVGQGIKNAGSYLAQLLTEADAQATQVANDAIYFSTSLADCMNTKIQARGSR